MLPEDSAARKLDETSTASKLKQGHVNEHFKTVKPEDRPVPYSDALFREAAIQWLIQTDQVTFKCLFLKLKLICNAHNSQFKHSNIPHTRK
jgi:hypothetical protein